jgi:CBS domain-containing protein
MFIKNLATDTVAECTEDTRLAEVYELLQKNSHGYVVVLDSTTHRVPIGVVDEHSICKNVITRPGNPKTLTAGDVMNSRIRRVNDTTPVEACRTMLEGLKDEPILVTDEKRQFLGILDRRGLEAELSRTKIETSNTNAEFGGLASAKTPARVEIPAFGWIS